jgi:gentisate 1,2-dioxygenase
MAQTTSHYDVQKQRRGDLVEDWNRNRKAIGKASRLEMIHSPARGVRQGMLIGTDGGVPTRSIDTRIVEIPPGGRTSTHRHSYDAIMFIMGGRGYTMMDGVRHEWGQWDALHTPVWSWHQHVNLDDSRPARYMSFSTAPLMEFFNLLAVEDVGDTPPPSSPPTLRPLADVLDAARRTGGRSSYESELERAVAQSDARRNATRHTPWDPKRLVLNKKGTRSAFLVDPSLGYRTTGLTAVMFQMAPGSWQASHRHGGEAVLFVVDGKGYSKIHGERYDWETGDGVLVGHWAWHQHFNAQPDKISTIIRLHMEESLGNLMRLLLWPLELFNEPEVWDGPDPAALRWPD